MFETSQNIQQPHSFTAEQIEALNNKYRTLSVTERIKELYKDFDISDVMLTSSFAATSAFLLKLVSDANTEQEVFFIDTGYHFEDTLKYKSVLEEKYNLNVTSISAIKEEHEFTTKDETWKSRFLLLH